MVEVAEPVIDFGSQLVGLSVNSGRLRFTSICRTSSGSPWRMVGIGSDSAVIPEVSGSTRRAVLTATTPRSNGPAIAGVMISRLKGAPL